MRLKAIGGDPHLIWSKIFANISFISYFNLIFSHWWLTPRIWSQTNKGGKDPFPTKSQLALMDLRGSLPFKTWALLTLLLNDEALKYVSVWNLLEMSRRLNVMPVLRSTYIRKARGDGYMIQKFRFLILDLSLVDRFILLYDISWMPKLKCIYILRNRPSQWSMLLG